MKENNVLLRSVLDLNQAPKDEPLKLYDSDGIWVATISNEIDWYYTRLQIKEHKIEGCYIIYKDVRYDINSDGRLSDYPKGMMETVSELCAKIIWGSERVEKYKPKSKYIDINKCPYNESVFIYDNEDNLICYTNSDLKFNWVRAEIKEKKLKGCYLIFRGERVNIDINGTPQEYPKGMFEFNTDQLCRLV